MKFQYKNAQFLNFYLIFSFKLHYRNLKLMFRALFFCLTKKRNEHENRDNLENSQNEENKEGNDHWHQKVNFIRIFFI